MSSPTTAIEQHTYPVTARRDGRFWYVDIPGVGATQARRLNEVDEMAIDYIAGMTGVDESTIVLVTKVVLPEEADDAFKAATLARYQAGQLQQIAAQQMTDAVKLLQGEGWTVREIGTAMNISYQRVQQLLTTPVRAFEDR